MQRPLTHRIRHIRIRKLKVSYQLQNRVGHPSRWKTFVTDASPSFILGKQLDNRGSFTVPTKVASDPLLLEQHLQQMAEAWAAQKEQQQREKSLESDERTNAGSDVAGTSSSSQSQATTRALTKDDLALLVRFWKFHSDVLARSTSRKGWNGRFAGHLLRVA